jgi:cytochrome c
MRVRGLAVLAMAALAGCSGGGNETPTNTADTTAPEAAEPAIAYASLTGDAAKGEKLYMQCRVCHSLEAGKNGIGPSLHGVIGQPAGKVAGFAYSPAMAASGLSWDEETLYRFVESPRKTVSGTKMAYAGMKDPQSRADLIAWLKTAAK